ncbi:MAG: hypothetical protein COX19_02210 [Desulfobacterales bacterium CG23_combo_of_CG06-09_8_20_14_all_51_8]|nr:MAG: hypothetical protein COX19_02210 [Desulfobacterales bacterium CG23_combo_of_CG06-09_8_20_14_all_51_8]
MDTFEIKYIFRLPHGRTETFDLRLDPQTLELLNKPAKDLPFWARLDFQQCPHCPLSEPQYPFCPVAANLVDVVKRFESIRSYDEMDVEVVTSERHVISHTTAQRGISSLLGVLFPASGCPHTAFFRPMVRFHLPLASEQDTIFRAGGMYLLAQYFRQKQGLGGELNFDYLDRIYSNMNLLNMNVVERLRHADRTESSVNAVVLLDVFTQTLPMVIDSQLAEIRYLFAPYLENSSPTQEEIHSKPFQLSGGINTT